MKVLHIGSTSHGGAGLGMMRLHLDLKSAGVESKILCRKKDSDNPDVFGFLDEAVPTSRRVRHPIRSILRRLHLYQDPVARSAAMVRHLRQDTAAWGVSSPFSPHRINKSPLVQEADIIHLHWVADFLDWPSFFRNVKKPIVWTIRDENPALGFWHFRSYMPPELSKRELHEEKWLTERKQSAVRACRNLAVISLSSELDRFIASSPVFNGRFHAVIPNSIDGGMFYRHDRETLRRSLGWNDSTKVMLFVSQFLDDPRKGLNDLLAAIQRLKRPDIALLCIGNGTVPSGSVPIQAIPLVSNTDRLSALYSAADLFVTPSYAESFGKTTTEALACGTPVVSYPNSGALDIIGPGDGVLAKDFKPEALAEAISSALARQFDPDALRQRVLGRFSPNRVATAYLDVYQKMLDLIPS